MLFGDVANCKNGGERDDGDCVPPIRKIVFFPINLDDDDGCKGCNGDYAHAHWLHLDLKLH
jgi:hypothetical protein